VVDRQVVNLEFEGGAVANFTMTGLSADFSRQLKIFGTKGQIQADMATREIVLHRFGEEKKHIPVDMGTEASGHGGGDYLTARTFIESIEQGKQPPFPFHMHAAVAMSSVAILAHRSMMEGGMPYDIPDFHTEEARAQYENDRLTPFIGPNGEAPTLPCCSHPDYRPSAEELAEYEALLKRE
jgi:hypothetical protein